MGAQGTAELGVEVVFFDGELSRPGVLGAFHQQLDSAVAEQPDANIGQVEMVFQQFRQALSIRLLQHHLQHIRRTTVTDKNTVVLGNRGVEPQAIAHHIGIGDSANALCCADIHIATDYHGGQSLRGLRHHTLVEGQLQVEQGL